MKRLYVLLIGLLMFACGSDGGLNNEEYDLKPEKAAEKTAEKIIQLSRNYYKAQKESERKKILNAATTYFAYQGDDEARRWKDDLDPQNEDELRTTVELLGKIYGTIAKAEGYSFTGFEIEKESEGNWYILYMDITGEGYGDEKVFAFLKVDGKFIIGDIE